MLKWKNILFLILIMVFCCLSFVLAYKPPRSNRCKDYQNELNRYFFEIEELEITPEEDFEKLYNKLLDKKIINKPLSYPTSDCSYGFYEILGKTKIYCKYHGNADNIEKFSSMSARSYYSSHYDYGLYVFFICGGLAFIISLVKPAFKNLNKNK